MKQNTIIVVGDKFKNFAEQENVMTISEIKNMLSTKRMKNRSSYLMGQGVSFEDRDFLNNLARRGKLGRVINGSQKRASGKLTHKHKTENIMITEPTVIVAEKYFQANVVTDDECAEMSDHVTGQHIQGMVITEAARQMMLAVGEKYLLTEAERDNAYCALMDVNTKFKTFAFPLEITMHHYILKHEQPKPGKHVVATKTIFTQVNQEVAGVEINYIFNDKTMLENTENKLAVKALAAADLFADLPPAANEQLLKYVEVK